MKYMQLLSDMTFTWKPNDTRHVTQSKNANPSHLTKKSFRFEEEDRPLANSLLLELITSRPDDAVLKRRHEEAVLSALRGNDRVAETFRYYMK
jgi:hypothetical protein